MNFSFHPEAEQEFLAAIDYYEICKPGLGVEFAQEIYATIHRILRFPNAWSELSANTRRCLATRFPFGVIYNHTFDHVTILAVMQLNRKPGYWMNR